MTDLLVAFLVVVLVPLVAGSWRISLLGLALQGLLLTWMAHRHAPEWTAAHLLLVFDLAVLRGVVAPGFLYRALQQRRAPARNDILPPNLLLWAIAGGLVLFAFRFGRAAGSAENALHLSVAAAALVMGLFVLATQESRISQIIGLLRMENAIALFELGSSHRMPLAVHGGVAIVFLLAVATLAAFAARAPTAEPSGAAANEGLRL